jgi:hypothetical protein
VNRIRRIVYEQLSALRHDANGAPRGEPASFTEFDAQHV